MKFASPHPAGNIDLPDLPPAVPVHLQRYTSVENDATINEEKESQGQTKDIEDPASRPDGLPQVGRHNLHRETNAHSTYLRST